MEEGRRFALNGTKQKIKNLFYVLLLMIVMIICMLLFNATKVHAIGSESFEAEPFKVYEIERLDELYS